MAKAASKTAAKPQGTIVAASLSAGGGGGQNVLRLDPRAIEDAMAKATTDALAKGITDPDEIRELKLAAREKVKAAHKKAEKAEIARIQAAAKKAR